MTEPDQWMSQIGRVHVEAQKALEREARESTRVSGAREYAAQFNVLLNQMKDNRPEDYVLHSISMISPEGAIGQKPESDLMSEVVLNSGRLIDHLGYAISDHQRWVNNTDATIIQMEQTTQQDQTATQTTAVTIEATIDMITHLRKTPAVKEDLRGIVAEFKEETADDGPNQSRIEKLIESANEKSPDVAANLLMIAIQTGILQAAELI